MPANVSFWSNVAVAFQSAATVAQTISAITKANPGVVTFTGTLPSNGAYILVTAQGMSQVDGRVFRVAGGSGQTLQLEGENTTSYSTFSSGSFQVITFGTTLTTARGVTASGGEFADVDTTTIHDQIAQSAPGLASAVVYNFDLYWDPQEAAFAALKTASSNKQKLACLFTFSSGAKAAFAGYIGFVGTPTGNAQDAVTTSLSVRMNGVPTYYAS